MATAREAFEAKKLAARYGVVGKVAAGYRMAGYEVEVVDGSPEATANFKAWRRGESLVVRVYMKSGRVPVSVVEELASASGGSKPVLVLYGSGPKLTSEVLEKARELGVSIRRFRS
ncbi:hypothetical protein APE_1985.1 [Aeropyrum pernix K1]|uniref:Restriction endonuclease type IV Mrr domain-containing protein n=1 Tax=Aeropyrum pernix (strain ATCC 700893 / DSM 11879 / JCM 9820 / NBRC 100138 / K1) TaxID=272557 RepID=Q9YAF4_AERPE|nr:hypothetical protein [Aeropyrum pernix]BAA80995.2 hypothetical protein APE_1985.1 [Aeropyrum pernix K1]